MRDKQIDFIICTNDRMYYNECIRYINELEIPEDYSVDILCIRDATSMAQGYNIGMGASNAKYKVYLHQDVFILNERFLYDILRIFEGDRNIGMIGVMGSQANGEGSIGRVDFYNGAISSRFLAGEYGQTDDNAASFIDGLIMVTQYDIPWREDIFDGWDMYDLSHTCEMRRAGYKVVIPYQEKSWCFHDCGVVNLKNFNYYKEKAVAEYKDILSDTTINEDENDVEMREELDAVGAHIINLAENGKFDELLDMLGMLIEVTYWDNDVLSIIIMTNIYGLEKQNAVTNHSEFFYKRSWKEMKDSFNWLRFVVLRILYNKQDERIEELNEKVQNGIISEWAVNQILKRMRV